MHDCPVCLADHPTGRLTATYGGLTHRSQECGQAASNFGVNARSIVEPRVRAGLLAVKRKYEAEGLPEQCPRCGFFCGDGEECQHCGVWLAP